MKDLRQPVPPDMSIRIHWTASSIEHISRHGVTRREVEEGLGGNLYGRRKGDRYLFLSRAGGRTLAIVMEASEKSPGEFEVVTARDANPAEKRLFKRRAK